MISKLITWGKDRETSMNLLSEKLDEYVVHGVGHNIGFGKSIVENEAYWKGDYNTAFIPTYYKNGYHGEELTFDRKRAIALAAFKMRNISASQNTIKPDLARSEKVLFVSIEDGDKNHDFKERLCSFSTTPFRFSRMSTTSSRTPSSVEYSCRTPSICTSVGA